MKTNLQDLYSSNPLKACRLALRRTAKLPARDRLEAIDKLLGNFGTEAIRGDWSGDPGRFIVSTVGAFVERNQEKYNFV